MPGSLSRFSTTTWRTSGESIAPSAQPPASLRRKARKAGRWSPKPRTGASSGGKQRPYLQIRGNFVVVTKTAYVIEKLKTSAAE
jgi:hypothetical protein